MLQDGHLQSQAGQQIAECSVDTRALDRGQHSVLKSWSGSVACASFDLAYSTLPIRFLTTARSDHTQRLI